MLLKDPFADHSPFMNRSKKKTEKKKKNLIKKEKELLMQMWEGLFDI